MPKIKELSKYNGSSWETGVPIGADASNIDVNVSGGSTQDLQTVLGTPSSSTNLQAQISNKLGKSDDGKDTTVSSITNWDGSSTETSTDLVTDVVATNGDSQSTLWSKFNRFRRRVGNKFGDYFATANIKTAYQTTGTDDDVYSTSLLNSYFSNVIGYAGTSAPEAGDIITQLSSLNNNVADLTTIVQATITGIKGTLALQLQRIGPVCVCRCLSGAYTTTTEGTIIGTIVTQSCRPQSVVMFVCVSTTGQRVQIYDDGKIILVSKNSGNLRFYGTYINQWLSYND